MRRGRQPTVVVVPAMASPATEWVAIQRRLVPSLVFWMATMTGNDPGAVKTCGRIVAGRVKSVSTLNMCSSTTRSRGAAWSRSSASTDEIMPPLNHGPALGGSVPRRERC